MLDRRQQGKMRSSAEPRRRTPARDAPAPVALCGRGGAPPGRSRPRTRRSRAPTPSRRRSATGGPSLPRLPRGGRRPMSAPPDPSSFTFEPLFAVLGLVATVVYVSAARIHRPGGWRIASFAVGIALIVLSVNSPLETLAVHYLLMAHLAQNALMADIAPLLVLLGLNRSMWEAAEARFPVIERVIAAFPLPPTPAGGAVRRPLRGRVPVRAAASGAAERRAPGAGTPGFLFWGAQRAVRLLSERTPRPRPPPGSSPSSPRRSWAGRYGHTRIRRDVITPRFRAQRGISAAPDHNLSGSSS